MTNPRPMSGSRAQSIVAECRLRLGEGEGKLPKRLIRRKVLEPRAAGYPHSNDAPKV